MHARTQHSGRLCAGGSVQLAAHVRTVLVRAALLQALHAHLCQQVFSNVIHQLLAAEASAAATTLGHRVQDG